MHDFAHDLRFENITPLENRAHLATPTMHGDEWIYIKEACDSGWVTTIGENINSIEKLAAEYTGAEYAAALSCGTAALHLAVKLAAERLYCSSAGIRTPAGRGYGGALFGKRVFCSDLTFGATVNPIVYEGGEPVFIDSEYETWNMDPQALERAFQMYPDVKLTVLVHLYGTAAHVREIRDICRRHGALLIEDAAESLGAVADSRQTGSFGDYGVVSFNGNKIITGSCGGMLLLHDRYSADKARKWASQSREAAPWYEHEELGYNYRISNLAAGVIRGQWKYIEEHIRQKKAVYERYKKGFENLPVSMNPAPKGSSFWLSCGLIDQDAMAETVRSGRKALYRIENGKSSPSEILEALDHFNAEGRPVWKPMHLQPIYRGNDFITAQGSGCGRTEGEKAVRMAGTEGISTDIFERGFCLPSDNKMTEDVQGNIIDIVRRCFL